MKAQEPLVEVENWGTKWEIHRTTKQDYLIRAENEIGSLILTVTLPQELVMLIVKTINTEIATEVVNKMREEP